MPLTEAFMSTNIRNAFILASFSSAISAVAAVSSKEYFTGLLTRIEKAMNKTIKKTLGKEHGADEKKLDEMRHKNTYATIISFLFTFTLSFVLFTILYFTIGFGGSMLTSCKPSECKWS